MPEGMSQGDQRRLHRADEPRLPEGGGDDVRRYGGMAVRRYGRGGSPTFAAFVIASLFTALPPYRLTAQVTVHAQAIPLLTRAWHTPGDKTLTEFALAQPAVMVEWSTNDPGAEMG